MKKGDRKLFEALTLPHLDRLLAAARRRVGSVELAEDVVQDAYLNAWRSFPDLSDPSLAYQWMYRILRRLIADHYRRDARRNALVSITSLDETYEALVSTGEDEPLERLIQGLTQQRLVELLERLPEDFAEVLFMHDLEGLKYSEIAEIANLPLGTVMSRIHRARHMLIAMASEHIPRYDILKHAPEEPRP